MTGQLAVPLHHVEGVGDIAVLPPTDRWDCGCGRTFTYHQPQTHICRCERVIHRLAPAPVVGQVVAHVEKCARCDGWGVILVIGRDGHEEICPGPCRGSGWVRDQYVRVTEVLPIWHTDNRPTVPGDPSRSTTDHAIVVAPSGVFRLDRDSRDPDYCLDLPGAVPGGVALIVEPAECATCHGSGCDIDYCRECGDEYSEPCARHADHPHGTTDDGCCHNCPLPVPVSAPSAPYTEETP